MKLNLTVMEAVMKEWGTREHSNCAAEMVALVDAVLGILEPLEHRDTTGEIAQARFLLELAADLMEQGDGMPGGRLDRFGISTAKFREVLC